MIHTLQSPAAAHPQTFSQNHRLFLTFQALQFGQAHAIPFLQMSKTSKRGLQEAFLKCSLPPSQGPSLVACLQWLSCPVCPSSELPGVRAWERLNLLCETVGQLEATAPCTWPHAVSPSWQAMTSEPCPSQDLAHLAQVGGSILRPAPASSGCSG